MIWMIWITNLHSQNQEENNDDLDDLDVLRLQLQGPLFLLLVRGAGKVTLQHNLEINRLYDESFHESTLASAFIIIIMKIMIMLWNKR